jgi:L-methionine (R)-S-oxide reductase
MAQTRSLPKSSNRSAIYEALLPQLESLLSDETDLVANQANLVASIKEALGFFWVGFYWAKENQLILGPFQGPIACTRIDFNRGVCGHAYTTGKTIVVPDVEQFPGHIACNSASRSEIVIPVFHPIHGTVVGVLDIDSNQLNDFHEVDAHWLEKMVKILEKRL